MVGRISSSPAPEVADDPLHLLRLPDGPPGPRRPRGCNGGLSPLQGAAARSGAGLGHGRAPAPQWYYIHNQAKAGPIAFAQLQELALTGRLAAADMVWRDGMAQWAAASTVDGLFPRPAPPPAGVRANETAVQPVPKSYPDAPPPTPSPPRSMLQRVQGVLDQFTNVLANLKDIKGGVLALVPSLPFLAGFFGDFLRPLAPFNFLFFLLSLLATLTLIGLFLRFPRLLTFRAGFACLACGVVCLIFGLWWGLALFGSSGDKGFLASNVGFVHYIQTAVVTRGENAVATDTTVKGDALADEVLREMQAEKDGEKLVAYALGGYPANVLKVEPVGDPKHRKGEGDEIVLEYDLRIGVDQEQYDRIMEKKVLPVLEKAATLKGESFSGAKATEGSDSQAAYMMIETFDRMGFDRALRPWRASPFGSVRSSSSIKGASAATGGRARWTRKRRRPSSSIPGGAAATTSSPGSGSMCPKPPFSAGTRAERQSR